MRGNPDPAQPTLKSRNEAVFSDSRIGDSSSVDLPPPSNLDGDAQAPVADSRQAVVPAGMPNLVDSVKRRKIVVPDFSQLAAEFQNTPLELPSLAANRSPTVTKSDPADAASTSPHQTNVPRPLKELTSAARQQPLSVETDSTFAHQAQSIATEFAAEDFEPVLKGGAGSSNLAALPGPPVDQTTTTGNVPPVGETVEPNGNFVRSLQIEPGLSFESDGGRPSREATRPNELATLAQRGVMGIDNGTEPPEPAPLRASQTRSKPMIPFGLNEQTRNNLARLRTTKQAEITLGTERFDYHVTENGDSLQSLSTKFYGRPDFYLDIYIANKHQLRNPTAIPAGLRLRIPLYD